MIIFPAVNQENEPEPLFEEAVEQQVAGKPTGKNPLENREGPDKFGNWFLHHGKKKKA